MKTIIIIILILASICFSQTTKPVAEPASKSSANEVKPESQPASQPVSLPEIDIQKVKAKLNYEAKIAYTKEKKVFIKAKNKAVEAFEESNKKLKDIVEKKEKEREKIKKSKYKKSKSELNALIKQYGFESIKNSKLKKEADKTEKSFNDFDNLIPGKNYFRKIDSTNLKDGSCGVLINNEIKVEKILNNNRAIVRIIINDYETVKNATRGIVTHNYTYKKVQLDCDTRELREGLEIKKEGIYYVNIVEPENKDIPEEVIREVKM